MLPPYRMLLLMRTVSKCPRGSLRPLLYLHIDESKPNNSISTTKKPSLSNRVFAYAERKWNDLAQASPHSPKHRIYRLGQRLLSRIPAQEWMLWRFYRFFDHHPEVLKGDSEVVLRCEYAIPRELQQVLPHSPPAPSNEGPESLIASQLLREAMSRSLARHSFWYRISLGFLPPLTIMTLLPFVKLVWAWVAFRTVTNFRAWQAARILLQLNDYGRISFASVATADASSIGKSDNAMDALAGELPDLAIILNKPHH